MAQNFSKGFRQNAVFAGVTTTTANSTLFSAYVDMANYNGVCFSALFRSTAASTGTCTFALYGAASSTVAKASAVAISGATATISKSTTATGLRLASIDVYHPQARYVCAKFTKLASLFISGAIAQQYDPRVEPAAASTTYAAATAAGAKVFVAMQSTST